MNKVKFYIKMAQHWHRMALGKSYWHHTQGLGRNFQPGSLRGYFNDLSMKIHWEGPVDSRDLPMCERADGRMIYFPTTLLQKALGHWDVWIATGECDDLHQSCFFKIADWLLENQDSSGGWSIFPLLGVECLSPYSAMTQGEGVSVLSRAYSVSQDLAYYQAARNAMVPLLQPMEEGGTCRYDRKGMIFEEVPEEKADTILNGWIFALYGLYDFSLIDPTEEVVSALESSLNALLEYLPLYDCGYWSRYDLAGHLASPFYHQLHIAQLEALALTFPAFAEDFQGTQEKFAQYTTKRVNRSRAVAVKAGQKILHPPKALLK